MDVFWCSCANDPLRGAIATACLQRWISESAFHDIHCVTARDAAYAQKFEPCHMTESIEHFMTMHRYVAEREAKSKIYVCADDDCMILGNSPLTKARLAMESHPDYAILAFAPYTTVFEADGDPDVHECAAPGGIYCVRRGILEIDTTEPFWDDTKTWDCVRAKGYKTGYLKRVRCNHFGAYLSTSWPERTGITQIQEVP